MGEGATRRSILYNRGCYGRLALCCTRKPDEGGLLSNNPGLPLAGMGFLKSLGLIKIHCHVAHLLHAPRTQALTSTVPLTHPVERVRGSTFNLRYSATSILSIRWTVILP